MFLLFSPLLSALYGFFQTENIQQFWCSMNCLMERKRWVFKCIGSHNPVLPARLSLLSLLWFLCFACVLPQAIAALLLLLCLMIGNGSVSDDVQALSSSTHLRWIFSFNKLEFSAQSTMRHRGGILQFLFGFIKILNNGFKITDKGASI